jgi:hypothetical protein
MGGAPYSEEAQVPVPAPGSELPKEQPPKPEPDRPVATAEEMAKGGSTDCKPEEATQAEPGGEPDKKETT